MMHKEKITSQIALLILLVSACSPTLSPPPASTAIGIDPTSTSMSATETPIPPVPSATPNPNQLPASARLGAVLSGSGAVERSLLTYDDLMAGSAAAPLDESAFSLPEEAARPGVVFEGRLRLASNPQGGAELIVNKLDSANDTARLVLPSMDLQFVQEGSFLIPVTQGLVYTESPYWNYIIGPGRIWQEKGDQGYARASFPFALVERNQNCTHNGVMAFLFNGTRVSAVRYQVTQETCLPFKFNLWGQVEAAYQPGSIPQAGLLKAAQVSEVANRLPTKPITALLSDYPDANIVLDRFGSGITPASMTSYGLVINGVNYVSACKTRFGEYAYCESLRLPSYSTAKSAFAGMALMRLGQKYGIGVYDLLIKDYVPEVATASGDWSAVTFRNALDMVTGNYDQADFEMDEAGATMLAFLDQAETYADKIKFAFRFPSQKPPNQIWIYHTSDTFIVTRAMNNYLVQREGSGADIFNFVRDEVYIPLHLSTGALTSLRTDNSLLGVPFGGYGLFWTRDDIAKIALLLNNQDGVIDGTQVLEPGLLAASLQRDENDRGVYTTGIPVFNYRNGFWAREWIPSQNRRYNCSFWTPFMSGYGGISVVLIPKGSTYYYFSDNNEFAWYEAVNESNKINPICP
jgi:CubicO group peptidase (beta-lactamase class C family)